MTDAATLRRDIQALTAALEETRAQMEAGLAADLTGLDSRVATLCAEAQSARGDAELAAALERLLPTLDAVAAALTRQRETLAAAAEGRHDPHTARQRASAAYGRGASAAPGDPPPDPPATPSRQS
ncbi:hypothetical protein D9623_11130 [Azospirillum brasilense]|uniref:Uncharacterized protein n=2 Tax=Azospirillum brasilense TaxID=192 RepID=A0A0P0EIT2_AZOBR|nr:MULTISPECIES: hypothetical protein [Azospirillum]ALJ35740.1 hypothetical protein AMK58_10070 [Azospirillum brasilense]MDW7555008.1 hypothetical protein [Azospirillum brasilense]MDW7594785.1 hypothetical protein [Azospirillum brasilense]MDW7629639.1 hypothetical protein [Azospirillum brasilense]MDX5954499.1 hypothetical protein [Azospirillum brasilense]